MAYPNEGRYPKVYTLDEYQKQAVATLICPEKDRLYYLAMQLCAEAGEVAGKIAKKIRKGEQDTWSISELIEVDKELGDVLWYVAVLAHALDMHLSEIANLNLDKLQDRKARGVLHGNGDNR